MNFWALSGLINGITGSILGATVYIRNKKSLANITYGLFCLTIAIWSYSYFFWQISTDEISALFWCRALMAGAIFIPICYLHYIFAHLNLFAQKKKIIILGYIFAFISLAFNFTSLFVKSVGPKMWFKYWPDAGVAYYPFLAIWSWIVFYGVYVIIKSLHYSTGIRQNQIKYILAATIVGWSGGATNYPLWFNIEFPPVGNILVSFYVAIIAYAIIKYRLMDINVVIGKGFVYTSLLAIIAGSYFGLILGVDKVFSGFPGYNPAISHFLIFLLVITVLIFILPKMRT